MTNPNHRNYRLAQALVESGRWRVDHATGYVYGVRGAPFTRTNTHGYIQIKFRDPDNWRCERSVLAHRVVWESMHGPLGDAVEINHRDGDKLHNAITNLEALSHGDNVRHARDTGLTPVLHGERNGNAILTADAAREVYERAWAGEDQARIGADHGVSRGAVHSIKQGWSWTHATGHQRDQPSPAA